MADAQPQMQDRYEKDPNIVSRFIEEEYILVPIRQAAADLESIYVLDGVGGRIWELVDGERTLAEILDVILEEYEVTPDVARVDLVGFIQQMEAVGGVRRIQEQ